MKKKDAVVVAETATIPDKEVLRAKLKGLISEIDTKLIKLGVTPTPTAWKASGMNFKMGELDSNAVNIHVSTDLSYLIKALCHMEDIKTKFMNKVAHLELSTTPNLTWVGINIDYWIHDLEVRINQVANSKKIQDLKDSKVKLEAFLSEEDRLIKTLGDVSGLLGIKQNLLS
jgi:hypothetical protein